VDSKGPADLAVPAPGRDLARVRGLVLARDLVELVPDLAVQLRRLKLVVRNAPHRAAVAVANSNIRRPKKAR
jgi:flagella basal body P-ring formation protein FlgA